MQVLQFLLDKIMKLLTGLSLVNDRKVTNTQKQSSFLAHTV